MSDVKVIKIVPSEEIAKLAQSLDDIVNGTTGAINALGKLGMCEESIRLDVVLCLGILDSINAIGAMLCEKVSEFIEVEEDDE